MQMDPSFWIFVTVAVLMGTLLPIVAIITKHKATMRQLEVQAMKIEQANQPDHTEAKGNPAPW